MKPLLAILIPSTPDRQRLLDRLMKELDRQRAGHDCIVIINETASHKDGGPTTGVKRNQLLDAAREQNASHVAFVDSDDLVGPTYIQRNMECVNGDYDTIELWGQYYEGNKQMNPFHHSIIYDKWWQDNKAYYRCNNHLNCMKLDLVKDIRFQDKTWGEDGNWAMDIQKTGVLKKEYSVKEITYFYFSGKNKNHELEPILASRRGISLH